MDKKKEIAIRYCNVGAQLLGVAIQKSTGKKQNDFKRLLDRYNILCRQVPLTVIDESGPHIWRGRDYIIKSNVDYFVKLKEKYSDEITEYEEIIKAVHEIYYSLSESEQSYVWFFLRKMLKFYITYVKLVQSN